MSPRVTQEVFGRVFGPAVVREDIAVTELEGAGRVTKGDARNGDFDERCSNVVLGRPGTVEVLLPFVGSAGRA